MNGLTNKLHRMKNNIIIIVLLSAVALTITLMAVDSGSEEPLVEQKGITIKLHKSPTCGCCGLYADYLVQQGYSVDIQQTADMTLVKENLAVPYELESCHTSEIDGYVVEGHVPEQAINKLLTDRPDIKGIGMAGMPSGSPGMPGPKEDFEIFTITHEGVKGELFIVL